jgi:hypothetical protein
MDEELVGSLVDAVDRAHVHAGAVFGILAGFGYDVRHVVPEIPEFAAKSQLDPEALRKIDLAV